MIIARFFFILFLSLLLFPVSLYSNQKLSLSNLAAEEWERRLDDQDSRANLYFLIDKYKEALKYNKKDLNHTLTRGGKDHPLVSIKLSNIALIHWGLGQYELAEKYFKQAWKIVDASYDSNHPNKGRGLNNLGLLYDTQGNFDQAMKYYKQALTIYEKTLDLEHPDIAKIKNNLATLYARRGQYEEAKALYLHSLKILEKHMGSSDYDIVKVLNNLGFLYKSSGEIQKAKIFILVAAENLKDVIGLSHPTTLGTINNLLTLFFNCQNSCGSQIKFKIPLRLQIFEMKTRKTSEKLIALWEKRDKENPNNPSNYKLLQYAMTILEGSQAKVQISEARLRQAFPELNNSNKITYNELDSLYKRLHKDIKAVLGQNHYHTGLIIENQATLYRLQKRYADAEHFYKHALKIQKKALGKGHPIVVNTLENLALLYQENGKGKKAKKMKQRIEKIRIITDTNSSL